ncbi:MAG: TadE/TadG family type IV pilus assembly protein [Planctomycetota bacterium]|jgi:Flp pilus assembly protein TadG
MNTEIRPQKMRYRGAATIEAAIVFPLLILLTFGIIEYGWMFLKAHQITNATRHGCRIAIRANATNAEVMSSINSLLDTANITGSQVAITPGDLSLVAMGETIEVSVTVPWANIAIMDMPFLPKPANIHAFTTMAKEGP